MSSYNLEGISPPAKGIYMDLIQFSNGRVHAYGDRLLAA